MYYLSIFIIHLLNDKVYFMRTNLYYVQDKYKHNFTLLVLELLRRDERINEDTVMLFNYKFVYLLLSLK